LARKDTDEKVCASLSRTQEDEVENDKPCLLAKPLTAVIAEAGLDVATKKEEKVCMSPKTEARRRAAMTSFVGRELKASGCDRLTRDDLEASLVKGGFGSAEIASGLQRLDDSNKIMLMDGLVFLV
jgi:hypothetical protein